MDDMDGNTATGDALVMATNEFIHRARDPSKGYPMVTILITDGQPNWGTANATVAAEDMKKNGITLFTIGIANADLSNLQQTGKQRKNADSSSHIMLLEIVELKIWESTKKQKI